PRRSAPRGRELLLGSCGDLGQVALEPLALHLELDITRDGLGGTNPHHYPRVGLWNQHPIPRAQLPGAGTGEPEGQDGGPGHLREDHHSHLIVVLGSPRPVGDEDRRGALVYQLAVDLANRLATTTARGSAHDGNTPRSGDPGDQLAVARLARQE